MHFHRWGVWMKRAEYTGRLRVRPDDSMVTAQVATIPWRECINCGQRQENLDINVVEISEVATGFQLPPLPPIYPAGG